MAHKDKENKTIVLPITETEYPLFLKDQACAHQIINNMLRSYPELFPAGVSSGYCLNGKTRVSKKQGVQLRKIRIKGSSYRIRPSYFLPYLRGKSAEANHGLFLLRFGVPFWALVYRFVIRRTIFSFYHYKSIQMA